MHGTVTTDEWITVGKPLPRIESARALDGRNVRIVWRGHSDPAIVDIGPAFMNLRIFARLRVDDAFFKTLRVNEDGTALEWDDGAELSAVWIEELADGSMTNSEFRNAMERMKMSLDGMAAHLGIARRLIAEYRKDKAIPKHIALATRYLLLQRTAYE